MKRLVMTLLSTIALVGTASAEVPVLNHYGPTGSTGVTAKSLSDNLNQKSYKTEAKFLTNCLLYKQTWDNSEKAIAIRDTTFNAGLIEGCDIPTNKDNLVMLINLTPLYLCNAGNGKTLEDFRKPGAAWKVADSNFIPKAINDKLAKSNNNKLTIIPYDSANAVATAAKAGELDFIWANGNWPELQLNGKCFITSGTNDVQGMQKGVDVWPNIPELKTTYGYWIIAKGFKGEELAKLKKDVRNAWETDAAWIELRKKRNFVDSYVDKLTEQQSLEIISRDKEIWGKPKQ
jgi:hypothetical protein